MSRVERAAKPAARSGTSASRRSAKAAAVPAPDAERRLAEAIEQQAATSEILRVISQSRGDVQPVFDTIANAALELCRASSAVVFTFDGQLVRISALASVTPQGAEALRSAFPRPPGSDSAATRAVLSRRTIVIPDVLEDADYRIKEPASATGFRSTVSVPLLRGPEPIGAIGVGRPEPGPFSDRHIAMLETFASQAVIAIENARLFTEIEARNRQVTDALEQQAATSDILRVISQSLTNTQPVFDTIAAAALKLCDASSANVFTFDGECVRLAAMALVNPDAMSAMRAAYPRPACRDNAASRAVMTRDVVAIPDVLVDADYALGTTAVAGGFRSSLAVPLLLDGNAVGAITVGRPAPGPFADRHVAMLQSFADQAVIAIENVRLFNALEARNRDVTDALAQQTATSEILRVISRSPTDVQPVFDIIAERAVKLCDAEVGVVSRVDGDMLRLAALHGVTAHGVEAIGRVFPMGLSAQTVSARTVRNRGVVNVSDVLDDPGYETKEAAKAGGFRGSLGVPMVCDGEVIGAIFVGRSQPGRFTDRQVELLELFADQAVIAVQNVRLFGELQTRTRQLTRSVGELKALGDVGQAVSSTLDLETVLSTIVSRATQLAGVDGGSIYEYDEARQTFHLHTAYRLPEALVQALRADPIRRGEGLLGRMAQTLEPVQIPDIADEKAYQSRVRELLIRSGYRSLLAVPLLREDRLVGGLAVNRNAVGAFEPEVIALLQTFASQSALAIQNARLFREIEQKGRELEAASRHKSEFLANMSHELRTPLNAIIGFSEVLAERMFGEINDKQAEYVGDILESGRHLLSLINDILDLSKIEAGRMDLDPSPFDLPTAIENTLILVRERAQRRNIALGRTIDARLGTIRADERKVKQVLLNLLSNALKFTPEGGRIDVRADVDDGAARIAVTDTGVGIAPEDQRAVFEEFRQVGAVSRKAEGTGLGLAISRKLIELHGGRLWLESAVGAGSTFTFTLPLEK
jgi:GAF domain-containing protein